MMHRLSLSLALLASVLPETALLAASPPNSRAADQSTPVLRQEAFNYDPGWEGHNNHIVPKEYPTVTQDFGYSRTNFAGKAAGEIGGRVHRASEAAFYGAKIEQRSLKDKLSASGSLAFTQSAGNTGVFFGWFNSKQPGRSGRPVASLGMNFDCEPGGARLAVFVITGQNQVNGQFITRYERYHSEAERAVLRPTPIRNDGTRYHWKLDYDPEANGGNGQVQFIIKSGSGTPEDFEGKKFTMDLPAGFKQQGTRFDRFGMMNLLKDGSSLTVHFDDLELDGQKMDFAQDPGWDGLRNHGSYQATEVGGAQDFGYRTTRHTAGDAGEIGGIMWRAPYASYADRVGPFTLNDRLEAHGRMFFEGAGLDAGVRIGWFNSAVKEVDDKAPITKNFVGVDIGGHTRVGHWFLPVCCTATGERHLNDQGTLPLLKAGTTYAWSVVYDPAANAGNGQMQVTLGRDTATLDLKPGVKAQGALMDRFGVNCVGTGGGPVKFYLDGMRYSLAPTTIDVLAPIEDQPGLPRVLLIGDSVSKGYTLPVRELLKGKANVHRVPANGGPTTRGLEKMDAWLGDKNKKWDVIYFNFGLHDLEIVETGKRAVEPADYEKNLRALAVKYKATGARLIWAATTPIRDGENAPRRAFGKVPEYNTIAQRVMTENGVTIDDLNTAITPHLEELQIPKDIHYKPVGYLFLAKQVAASIEAALPR